MTGSEIRELRLAMGLDQMSFAQRIPVALTTVSRWETGSTERPSPMAMRRLRELAEEHRRSLAVA